MEINNTNNTGNKDKNRDNKDKNQDKNVIIDCNEKDESDEIIIPVTKIHWTPAHENILIEWADQAMCYKWMHATSRLKYNRKNALFTIPVIIMSTLTGTANFAAEKIPEAYRQWFSIGVGSVNLIAGILTTIQQFLKITELNEAHRVASISWDKFYRNIKVELSKSPHERFDPFQMIKISKEEFDRLVETSPPISRSIIDAFITTFSGGPIKNPNKLSNKQKNYEKIKKPEICNILESTRLSIYKEDISNNPIQYIQCPVLPETPDPEPIKKTDKEIELENITEQIIFIIDNFNKEYYRKPSIDEIRDNLSIPVKTDIINSILKKL